MTSQSASTSNFSGRLSSSLQKLRIIGSGSGSFDDAEIKYADDGAATAKRKIKVMVMGTAGVGKTALVVRFITGRFIGDYESSASRLYKHQQNPQNVPIQPKQISSGQNAIKWRILDCAPLNQRGDSVSVYEDGTKSVECGIRWADAFVLVFSVTDRCSLDECNRLKFLINYNKHKRWLNNAKDMFVREVPVFLVGNKSDLPAEERMVSEEEGRQKSADIGCVSFHEISVRENAPSVLDVFNDISEELSKQNKLPKLKRSTSESYSPPTLQSPLSISKNSNEKRHFFY